MKHMIEFETRGEMILWVIDNYYFGYTYKIYDMTNMNDLKLSREITYMTHDRMKMRKKNNKYYLEYLF